MNSSLRILVSGALSMSSLVVPAAGTDSRQAQRFFETDIHLMVGGSTVMQNYTSCFPEIRELSSSMGTGWGVGLSAELGLRSYLALGTQINLLASSNRVDFAISNENATSVSNVFLKNRFYYLNFPVYLSFKLALTPSVRWNVDGGFYYSYGVGGHQRQAAYTSIVNPMGQLITRSTVTHPAYFENDGTFINRFLRGDIGLYAATSLTVRTHYSVGVRTMVGFKNTSTVGENGIKNPRIQNLNLMMVLGYKF